jgi:alpha 1,2-mannosyltransferase
MPFSENLRNGGRPPAWAVEVLQSSLAAWMAAPPPYPADAFSGRGVVITGGHLRFWSGALVGFASLRKQGCRLPFELWVLESELLELPPKIVRHLSERMGVAVRVLPKDDLYGAAGYRAKVSAILASSFEEVLFMDADNIALRNACALFDEPLYNNAGALFWKDFWEPVSAEVRRCGRCCLYGLDIA